MRTTYRHFAPEDLQSLSKLIKAFYTESPGNTKISSQKISKTFHEFTIHPEKGMILVFEVNETIVGYTIIFKGWSNEHGKDLLFIDELYVIKKFRSQGIASGCLEYVIKTHKKTAASLILAIEPGNIKAEKLYKKIGFKGYQNKTLFYKL